MKEFLKRRDETFRRIKSETLVNVIEENIEEEFEDEVISNQDDDQMSVVTNQMKGASLRSEAVQESAAAGEVPYLLLDCR